MPNLPPSPSPPRRHYIDRCISVEQNTKLSKTLFIMICASVALWVPSLSWYNISVWFPSLFPHFLIHIFTMLHITNSLVNPIIYSLRIPVFKKTMQQVRNKVKVVKRSKSYTISLKCSKRLKREPLRLNSLYFS